MVGSPRRSCPLPAGLGPPDRRAFRDDRYLPFEGSGVVSEWQLELPGELRAFDYDTIQDVVLHLRYTAREGGAPLRTAARAAFSQWAAQTAKAPLSRMFSLRHEFAVEWAGFLTPVEAEAPQEPRLVFELAPERFPIQFRGKTLTVREVEVFVKLKSSSPSSGTLRLLPPGVNDEEQNEDDKKKNTIPLEDNDLGMCTWSREYPDAGASLGTWTLHAVELTHDALAAAIEDVVLLCHYSMA